ncbi:alpha-L-arabinofuranosidase C-terminal domain-containing protein, partial [Acinetobacter baumannii]
IEAGTIDTAKHGTVPAVDAVATHDAETGEAAVFLVHRGRQEPVEVAIDVTGFGDVELVETHLLHDDDPYASNTLEHPDRVQPGVLEG